MSERKVLTKYYPPDFDPSLVGRSRAPKQSGPKVQVVRLMAPFSLRCVSCGEYMYRGRKFNARKETPLEERYLGIQIYRFYIRCTRCSAEIVFRTDPKNQDYVVEKGAKRNTEPWKRGLADGQNDDDETDDQRLDRLEREMAEAAGEEERNAMAELEQKTADAKREMAVADALDEIRVRNARMEKAQRDGVEIEIPLGPVSAEEEERRRQEEEDAEAARRAFAFARGQEMLEEVLPMDDDDDDDEKPRTAMGATAGFVGGGTTRTGGVSSSGLGKATATSTAAAAATTATSSTTDMPPPSFKRVVKKKKDRAALLGIKKKA